MRGVIIAACAACALIRSAAGGDLDCRWFYTALRPWAPAQWTKLTNVVDTAARHGYNGMILEARYEDSCIWEESSRRAAKALSDYCSAKGVEVIPLSWGVGYNAMLHVDPNLAEGMPVDDLPYEVSADGRQATMVKRMADVMRNPDFEMSCETGEGQDPIPSEWEVVDKPGHCICQDGTVSHSGRRSVRMDNLQECRGQVRIKQRMTLGKSKQYMMSLWFKTDRLYPNGSLMVQGYAVKGDAGGAGLYTKRVFADSSRPPYAITRDWTEVRQAVFPDEDGTLDLWIGTWGGKSGTVWIDDITIREAGLPGVVRRAGCPFVVKNAKTGFVYEEGWDYAPVPGLKGFAFGPDAESVRIEILTEGRIRPRERLLVSGYGVISMNGCSQVATCMRERRLYELMERNVADLVETFGTKTWFIACDEIRQAGTCASCAAYLKRGGTLGELLAMSLTKMREIILRHQPGSRIVIWNDMFSPLMNATRPFHLNPEPFGTKGIEKLPKDIIVADWHCGRLEEDMGYFTDRGFKTVGALFYDAKDLAGAEKNLWTCRENPNCQGAIYTTWANDYRLLPEFGDMMRRTESAGADSRR